MGGRALPPGGVRVRGRVTVYGTNVMKPPLCDDPDAQLVVVRNADGAPMILLARLNGADTWGLVTPEDNDWAALCVRYGLLQPKPYAEVLASAREQP